MLALQDWAFFIGPIVRGEVVQLKEVVDGCVTNNTLNALPDDGLLFDDVADFADQRNLGFGESECILFCVGRNGLNLCSDDRKARSVAAAVIVAERILGTADLVKERVRQGILTPQDAFAAYEVMRSRGAFLPALERQDFIL